MSDLICSGLNHLGINLSHCQETADQTPLKTKPNLYFEVLGLHDRNGDGWIEKRPFRDAVGLFSEGYRPQYASHPSSGSISEESAREHIIKHFNDLSPQQKQVMIDYFVAQTGPYQQNRCSCEDLNYDGFCTRSDAYQRLKQLNYKQLSNLALKRFFEKDDNVSLSALEYFFQDTVSPGVKGRFFEHFMSQGFWRRLTDRFGIDYSEREAVIKWAIKLGADSRVTRLFLDKFKSIEAQDGAYRGSPDDSLILKDALAFILAGIADKGFHQEEIKSALKEYLLSESGQAYYCRESILPALISDRQLCDDTVNVLQRFFDKTEVRVCWGFHETVRSVCQTDHITLAVGGALMLRVKPKGARPDLDVLVGVEGAGGTAYAPMLSRAEAQKLYLSVYIEKNMNDFSYRGHKIWEYDQMPLYDRVFGTCNGFTEEEQKANQRQRKNGGPVPETLSPDIMKWRAIIRLIEETPGLFDQICPLDPRFLNM